MFNVSRTRWNIGKNTHKRIEYACMHDDGFQRRSIIRANPSVDRTRYRRLIISRRIYILRTHYISSSVNPVLNLDQIIACKRRQVLVGITSPLWVDYYWSQGNGRNPCMWIKMQFPIPKSTDESGHDSCQGSSRRTIWARSSPLSLYIQAQATRHVRSAVSRTDNASTNTNAELLLQFREPSASASAPPRRRRRHRRVPQRRPQGRGEQCGVGARQGCQPYLWNGSRRGRSRRRAASGGRRWRWHTGGSVEHRCAQARRNNQWSWFAFKKAGVVACFQAVLLLCAPDARVWGK
jgi:hypothetical protein